MQIAAKSLHTYNTNLCNLILELYTFYSEAARFVAAGKRAGGLAAVQNAEDALLQRPIVAPHD